MSTGGTFEGRVAVVTGGASGIGRATVLRLLDDGASVVSADFNAASGEALVEEVASSGSGTEKRLRFVRSDVSVEADVEAAVATAVDEFGRLDIMVNNAGVGGAFGPVENIEVDDWDWTFGVLVRGVFLGVKHASRVFKRQGDGGAIVNTASVAGLRAGAGPLAYSTAKAGVINLTRAAALELAEARIRVNAVCPGGINTPLLNYGNPDAVGQFLDQLQPWPEHGRPEDVAAAICFLASDDARFITGEALVVDGGLTISGGTSLPGARGGRRGGPGALLPEGASGVSKGSTGEEPVIRSAG
ncbi:MAG TPA: SDR family oxidoreductase [Acidimicrobiales bacterium]|nr:SDR family oxidoreductase [Acidimicrobiales bacterium]